MCDFGLTAMIVGGALLGGTVSAATGGDFGKGMMMGALTGGIGVGVTRAIDMSSGNGNGLLGKNSSSSSNSTSSQTTPTSVQQIQAATSANSSTASTSVNNRSGINSLITGVKTSSQGLGLAPTTKKELLGQ